MTLPDQREPVCDGLYIPHGTTVLRQQIGGEEQVWVAADDFMVVQKDRDDARRILALINALRVTSWLSPAVLKLLGHAGLTQGDGEAMASIIAQFRDGSLASDEERQSHG